MEYAFKRGYRPDMERIEAVLREAFPCEIQNTGGHIKLTFGSMQLCEIWIDGKKLNVLTTSKEGAADEVVLDTNRRFRKFLEEATGYTAKQRMQMAKKEAQGTD